MIKKVQLLANDGVTEIIPITSGSCVQMKNGSTLEQEIGETDRFSPIIETDSSMSKVGVGTDIDVSLNVKDGAYEECVFEGRSLVNLFSRVSHAVGIWGREDSSSSLLKPNTRYTVSIQKLPPNCQWTLTIDVNGVSTMMFPYLNSSNKIAFDTLENVGTVMMIHLNDGGTTEITKDMIDEMKPMVIEGDYTKVDIPYFIGLCDVKMPILRNIGKNLCNIEEYNNFEIYSQTVTKDGDSLILETLNENAWRYVTVSKVFLEAGKQYTISCNCEVLNATEQNLRGILVLWSIDHVNNISGDATNSNNFTRTFTATESQEAYVKIYSSNGTGGIGNKIKYSNIQVEESPSKTPYEDYKTNILRTSEEIVLRSVGDIKDSYNALTGEYVQRIVEYVFNGSESEVWNFSEMKGDNYRFGINLPTFGNKSADKTALICDRLKVGDVAQEPKQEQITTYNHDSHFELRISLSPSTLASNNVDELRRYLQANPITIQYAVAEPTTVIVKPHTTPFAYQDGHVILESGHEGQSLLPSMRYCVATNRTGMIAQHNKLLLKQEQQLNNLEVLLLNGTINLDYQSTLLTFKLATK